MDRQHAPPPGREHVTARRRTISKQQVDATIVNVATPAIHASLGASGAALELVIGGYLVAFAVLLITGARLGQARGPGECSCSGWPTRG